MLAHFLHGHGLVLPVSIRNGRTEAERADSQLGPGQIQGLDITGLDYSLGSLLCCKGLLPGYIERQEVEEDVLQIQGDKEEVLLGAQN